MGIREASTNFTGFFKNIVKIENGKVVFPDSLGKVDSEIYTIGSFIKMMVSKYELKKESFFKRVGNPLEKDIITFSFRNLFYEKNTDIKLLPVVQVSSGDIDIEIKLPAKIKTSSITISVQTEFLKMFLSNDSKNKHLDRILGKHESFLYEQILSQEMRKTAEEIIEPKSSNELKSFYMKLKAGELIYQFFEILVKREDVSNHSINASDIKALYKVKDDAIKDLSLPPNLKELTKIANMSESKMVKLFKQIFGMSIYKYFQSIRMTEAADLLKEHNLSVSDVGHQMGFTNLSHFARVFEEHVGMKPKKYSKITHN